MTNCQSTPSPHRLCEFITMLYDEHEETEPRRSESSEPFSALVQRLNGQVDFERAYRMSPACFRMLLRKVKPGFIRTYSARPDHARKAGRKAPHALAITLRLLAGASYLDLRRTHGCDAWQVRNLFHRMIRVVDESLDLVDFWSDWEERGREFGRRTLGIFDKCIGAIDGWLVPIVAPRVENRAFYWCRKGFYCLNVQAIVDHRRRFIYFSSLAAGATHDATAFALTSLAARMGDLGDHYIVGDAAYGYSPNLVTPYKGTRLPPLKDSFNFYQSNCRIVVECAFGILGNRFGLLTRPIKFSHRIVPLLVRAAMKIHNEITDFDGDDRYADAPQESSMPGDHYMDAPMDHRVHRSEHDETRRDALAAALSAQGFVRPRA